VEFAQRLFGKLNRDFLGLPSDGKVTILSDSDKEEDVCEETVANAEAACSAVVKSSTLAPSAADADEDPGKMQADNSVDLAPGQDTDKSNGGGDKVGSP
jgi:hypothetical protein